MKSKHNCPRLCYIIMYKFYDGLEIVDIGYQSESDARNAIARTLRDGAYKDTKQIYMLRYDWETQSHVLVDEMLLNTPA